MPVEHSYGSAVAELAVDGRPGKRRRRAANKQARAQRRKNRA